MLFVCMALPGRKYLQKCCIFLNSAIKEFTWFHDWWLAKSWSPIVEQLFHSWAISLISGALSWDTSLFWPSPHTSCSKCVPLEVIYYFDIRSTIGHLMFHRWGGKLFHDRICLFFIFSDRNNFFFHTLEWLGLTKVMSILTASNPLILALVLSLYHFSKESYRILKLKKSLSVPWLGILPYVHY